jgi:DNA-binding transcriptional ArsR family regulator
MNLLTNDLYLYLLVHQHQFEKVNYSELSKVLGKTRQTISKYYQVLLEEEVIEEDDLGFIVVNNLYSLNEEELNLIEKTILKYPSNYIAYLICKNRHPDYKDSVICNMLDISYKNFGILKQDLEISNNMENYVYAIIQDKVIKYVGSTAHLTSRIESHCRKRPFLREQDFIILEKCNKIMRFDREAFYRQLFKPEWNEII